MNKARDEARSAHMEHSGGCQYNPLNGSPSKIMAQPNSEIYAPRTNSPIMSLSDVHAGRPTVRSGRMSPYGIKCFEKAKEVTAIVPDGAALGYQQKF